MLKLGDEQSDLCCNSTSKLTCNKTSKFESICVFLQKRKVHILYDDD